MINVRKDEEFEAFIKLLENGSSEAVESWEMVAESLGVHPNTIVKWKRHPKAKKAIVDGIKRAVSSMENVGKRDWRMWREKLALLTKENQKKEDAQNTVTNNLIVMGDDALAKYLYGFVKDLSGNPEKSKDDADRGESTTLPESGTG